MAAKLINLLSTSYPPEFIYLHHPHHPSSSSSVVPSLPNNCVIARLDGIEHHTLRLLYSGVLSRLRRALRVEGEDIDASTWDGFSRSLKDVWEESCRANGTKKGAKWKGKAKEVDVNGHSDVSGINGEAAVSRRIVLVITKAERLRSVLGGGWAVITRLGELTGLPATVVLASQIPWNDIRSFRGDAHEPIHIFIPPLTRQETLQNLLPASPHPLFPRFLDLLLATLGPLLPAAQPKELSYLAEALWPIYTSLLPPHFEQLSLGKAFSDPDNPPPPLVITVKLLTDLKNSLATPIQAAMETLLPHIIGPKEFTSALLPSSSRLDGPSPILISGKRTLPKPPSLELPTLAKYLLIAAYCASYNPPKSDLRLFGRGVGVGGKRKKGGGTRRVGYGKTRIGKVNQRLLGPKPFGVDRFLAIFAAVYGEHAERPVEFMEDMDDSSDDSDGELEVEGRGATFLKGVEEQRKKVERQRRREEERDQRWDEEVWGLCMGVKLWSMIPDLESQSLLRRTSPSDRLDNIMLRCEIDYEVAKSLSRELKITLDEYLYEGQM